MINTIQDMLNVQADFQERVDTRYNSDVLEDRVAYIKDHFVYCNQELNEMLYELPYFKSWKDYSGMTVKEINVAIDKAKEEMVDAWHFFMNMMLALGMDEDELVDGYFKKHKENIRRQDEGYTHDMKHVECKED